jgi:hypothetical protein
MLFRLDQFCKAFKAHAIAGRLSDSIRSKPSSRHTAF